MKNNKKIPKSLFKYKTLNDYTVDLLKDDSLYLSPVSNFNDPYEGDILLNWTKYWNDFLNKENIKNSKKLSSSNQKEILKDDSNIEENFSKFIDKTYSKKLPSDWLSKLNEVIKSQKENMVISCFSESNLINPLWTHYASNHKGICIEYNFKDDKTKDHKCKSNGKKYNFSIKDVCHPINYVSPNQHPNLIDTCLEFLKDFDQQDNLIELLILNLSIQPFLYKSNDWSYEKEYRIILNSKNKFQGSLIKKRDKKYFIKLPEPTAVYLGLNITKENKEKVKNICEKRDIQVYKMEKNQFSYNLKKIKNS